MVRALVIVLLVATPLVAQSVDPAIPAPVTLHYAYRDADGAEVGAFAVAVRRIDDGYVFEETSGKRMHRFDRTMIPLAYRAGDVEMVRNTRGYDVTTPKRRALLEAEGDARIFYSIFFMLMGYDFAARRPLEFTPVDYRALDMPRWKRALAQPRLRVTWIATDMIAGAAAQRLRIEGVGMLGGAFPGYDVWYAAAPPHYLLRTKPGSAREKAVTLERVE